MNLKNLPSSGLLKKAWALVKKHYWRLLGFGFLIFAINFGVQLLVGSINQALGIDQSTTDTSLLLLSLGLTLLSVIVQWILSIASIRMLIKVARDETFAFDDLLSSPKLVFRYVITSICYLLVVFVGFILLIVPGIIWMWKYYFALYLVIDKNMGVKEAFKASSQMTKDNKWNLFLYSFGLTLINVLGFIALGVGLFVTIPLTTVSFGLIYLYLLPNATTQSTAPAKK